MKISLRSGTASIATTCSLGFAPHLLTGCDRKDEVLDVETPQGEFEVERDPDTGATEIETDE